MALLHTSDQAPFADPLQAEHPLPPSTMTISHKYLRRENDVPSCPPGDDTPYATASEMRKSVREQNSAAAAKAKTLADLAEARRQRDFYADQEARLSVLASESFDEVMGDCKEELSACRALKKSSLKDGRASSN